MAHFLGKDKIFVKFFWKIIHKYFFIKLNALKGYRLDLIQKNLYFYDIICLNMQKNTIYSLKVKKLWGVFCSKNSKKTPKKVKNSKKNPQKLYSGFFWGF